MRKFIKKYEGDIIIVVANLTLALAFVIVYLNR